MGFKSVVQYNEELYSGMFLLRNDGDSARVIFLYRSIEDVLMANTHYIKSDNYSGYVHCLGRGCPACERGLRVQNKLFIPLYDIDKQEVLFWDRGIRFQQQLEADVFSKFPNPSEFIFRITRQGGAGDINTRYAIQGEFRNVDLPYDKILESLSIKLPDYYDTVVKDWSEADYRAHLTPTSSNATVDVDTMPEYKLSPRATTSAPVELPDLADFSDNAPDLPAHVSQPSTTVSAEPASEDVVNF